MNCTDFEAELKRLVEQHGSDLSESAIRHHADCTDCQDRWRDEGLLAGILPALRVRAVPAGLADRVLAELRRESLPSTPGETPVPSRHGWWVVGLVAASVLVVVGLGLIVAPPGSPPALAIRDPLPTPPEVGPSVAAVLADLRSEYLVLATEGTATAQDLVRALPSPPAPWPEPAPIAQPELTPVASAGVVTVGKSIGSQIAQAVDFLRLTVPSEEPGRGL